MSAYSFAYKALKIIKIRDAGTLASERVVLRADKAVDLIEYLVLNAMSVAPKAVRDLNQHVFWFPRYDVAAGDFVRLYSRSGKRQVRDGTYGDESARYHDFFWGKSTPVWTATSNAVVLVELAEWSFARLE